MFDDGFAKLILDHGLIAYVLTACHIRPSHTHNFHHCWSEGTLDFLISLFKLVSMFLCVFFLLV